MLEAFNRHLYHGMLLPVVVILLAVTIILGCKKKVSLHQIGKYVLLILPSVIYFWGISKAAPFVAIRYVSPVSTLLYAFIVIWLVKLSNKIIKGNIVLVFLCILVGIVSTYYPIKSIKGNIYREKMEVIQSLADEIDYCAYITGDQYNWKMWEDYINYPEFKGLFFIDGQKKNIIEDPQFLKQEEIVVFVDKTLELEEIEEYLFDYFPEMDYEITYETSYISILRMKANR